MNIPKCLHYQIVFKYQQHELDSVTTKGREPSALNFMLEHFVFGYLTGHLMPLSKKRVNLNMFASL